MGVLFSPLYNKHSEKLNNMPKAIRLVGMVTGASIAPFKFPKLSSTLI